MVKGRRGMQANGREEQAGRFIRVDERLAGFAWRMNARRHASRREVCLCGLESGGWKRQLKTVGERNCQRLFTKPFCQRG
jgi:hypothetical protein